MCRCEPALCVHVCKRVVTVMLHPSLTVTWRCHSHRTPLLQEPCEPRASFVAPEAPEGFAWLPAKGSALSIRPQEHPSTLVPALGRAPWGPSCLLRRGVQGEMEEAQH